MSKLKNLRHFSSNVEGPESRAFLIYVAAVLLGHLYVIGCFTGTFTQLQQAIGPYMPDWVALTILLLAPVTYALATLPSTGPGTGLALGIVFCCQTAIMSLAARQHPLLCALVILFLYVEAFSIVPRRNQRLSGKNPYTTLNLRQSPPVGDGHSHGKPRRP